MYKYQVGSRVAFTETPFLTGTIVSQCSYDEEEGEPCEQLNPSDPWYHIEWDSVVSPKTNDPRGGFVGFEHEDMLMSV